MANSKRRAKRNAHENETEQASFALTVEVRITITVNLLFIYLFSVPFITLSKTSSCCLYFFFFLLFNRSLKDKAMWRWSLAQHGRASGGKCVCWCHSCGPGEVCGCRVWCFCVLGCWLLSASSMCLYPFTAGISVRLDSQAMPIKVCINLIHTGLIYIGKWYTVIPQQGQKSPT